MKEWTCALVPISGAGTSVWIPIRSWIFWVKTRVRRSNSLMLNSPGAQPMPPFAPPYGMSATAVFQVISWARAFTSSGSTLREQVKKKPSEHSKNSLSYEERIKCRLTRKMECTKTIRNPEVRSAIDLRLI